MKNIMIILGVVAVAGLGAYYVFGNQMTDLQAMTPPPSENQILDGTSMPTTSATSPQPSVSPSPQASMVEVTLGKSGYAPQTITVKVGTTVVFVNRSGAAATVSSDPHPVHNTYPALNLGQFMDGESRSLVFPTAGTYGYHNHLNPSQKGTVMVIQ